MSMNVLHIIGDYPFQSLYYQLLRHFSEGKKIKHMVYVPLEYGRKFSRKYDISTSNMNVMYSYDFSKLDRLLYHTKKRKILESIQSVVKIEDIGCIHAHTLFSTGGIAYDLKKKRGINYIVAVRNTDLNTFFKYMVHLRKFGIKILTSALKVVFMSPIYRDIIINKYVPDKIKSSIFDKSVVVPNGIADFWHRNRYYRIDINLKDICLLYIGEISRNKNIETTIRVAQCLRKRGLNTRLTIVGSGPDTPRIRRIIGKNCDYIELHNWTDSQEKLISFYRSGHVFVMPSFNETFGLVYIEALSQGLPLIYTRGQGIDGYFPQGYVGYACNPVDIQEIADRIECIIGEYLKISKRCTDSTGDFSWNKIASQYETIYEELG